MKEPEQQLLAEATGGTAPRLCLRTGTRIDTGRWGRRSPVWLCVMDDELVLLAVGRRRYLERVPLAQAAESFYDHGGGALVIAPCDSARVRPLKMTPSQALEVLPLLSSTVHSQTTHP